MTPVEIIAKVGELQDEGKSCFVSSSFQTHSIPLLHVLSQCEKKVPVAFLNTGFHFPETLQFRDEVVELLDLDLIELSSDVSKIRQRDANGDFLFHTDPDECCWMNKVKPMEELLWTCDIWINGVRASQSATRKAFSLFQPTPQKAVRFHPILDWTAKMVFEYRREFDLPEHPLEKEGYFSIGCEPCTQHLVDGRADRQGRWQGMKKSECGLHTHLASDS